MGSTGVSWKPVYHLLEGRFALMLVNARHIKNVPGRKTDEGRRVDRPVAPAWAADVVLRPPAADP